MTQTPSTRAQARASSWLMFALLAVVSYAVLIGVGGLFPGDRTSATLGRAASSLAIVALLLAGSFALLKRDNLPADRFGLAPTPAHARAFLLGCLGACLVMAILIGTLYVVLPFEWQRGSRSIHDVGLAAVTYLIGNSVEELLFRGYALVALAHAIGTTRALWLLALLFGLSHAPGLDAMSLGKMILTTGAMHFVFAYAYLGTRSMWAAIGLHALANLLLHAVSGFGQGASAFDIVLKRPLPTSFDLPFAVFLFSAAAVALLMSRLPAVRRGMAWIQGTNPG